MKKCANDSKRLHDAMFETLDKYDLLPEANENFEIIRENARMVEKLLINQRNLIMKDETNQIICFLYRIFF
jgi:hypothetical protein